MLETIGMKNRGERLASCQRISPVPIMKAKRASRFVNGRAISETSHEKGGTEMANANVVQLTADNWEKEVVQSDKPVLVDFWAVWCGPCRALGPTIEKLADKYVGKVKVGKLNTDEAQEIAIKYGISSIPMVMLLPQLKLNLAAYMQLMPPRKEHIH